MLTCTDFYLSFSIQTLAGSVKEFIVNKVFMLAFFQEYSLLLMCRCSLAFRFRDALAFTGKPE